MRATTPAPSESSDPPRASQGLRPRVDDDARTEGPIAQPAARAAPRREGDRATVPVVAPEPISLTPRRRNGWRLLLLAPILLGVVGAGLMFAYRSWYDSSHFVITENAQVTGDLVQVGSLNAGRVVATRVDVGDRVQQGQEIALVTIPHEVAVPFSGTTRLEETAGGSTQAPVRAPLAGVVVARLGHVGSTVSAGQPIYALVDPGRIWVRANVEETKVARVQPGQPVDVHVDALGQTFPGRVVSVSPASAATFSLLPAQNASGNFVKVVQLVPVKISVDSGGAILPLGTSASVRIRVREPDPGLPWHP